MEPVFLEENRPLFARDPATFTDAEALTRLVEVEEAIAGLHATRARLVALVAANRPAAADRPAGQPGAKAATISETESVTADDLVPEVLDVSEWLSHELQMAHPYSLFAAKDLVETSLVLSGIVDAAALRRRNARARKAADVGYYPTQDGMARLYADLPLLVAAACVDAVGTHAAAQHNDGDLRPIGQIRTEILTDLILRPWDTSRPAVTGEVTIHLTIPTSSTAGGPTGGRLDEDAAEAEVNGQVITAAHCWELLTQLDSARLFLALHQPSGTLATVGSPAQLRRAARRRNRRERRRTRQTSDHPDGMVDGPGLAPPADTHRYRPTRAQDRYARTRDRHCRHFGCTRKAIHADLDHHHPWPEGKTGICNLCAYCRTHHRLKHQAPAWARDLGHDGTLSITTPTGITRTTRPPGTEWPLTTDDLPRARPTPGLATPVRPRQRQPDNDSPPF